MFSKRIAIDIGASTVVVHVRGDGIVVREPSCVAINGDARRVLGVGHHALDLGQRSPGEVRVIRPIADGVVRDRSLMVGLIEHLVTQAQGRQRLFKPDVMMAVPSDVGGQERRGLAAAAIAAGARQAWLIEKPLAAALGAGVAVSERRPKLICDIGGASAELAIIAQSGLVATVRAPLGGRAFDRAFADWLRAERGLLIDAGAAEQVKLEVGCAVPLDVERACELTGAAGAQRSPRTATVTSTDFASAIGGPLQRLAAAIGGLLEQAPRTVAESARESGLVLTGGSAVLRRLDTYLGGETGLNVRVGEDPGACVALGAGAALDQFEVLKRNQLHIG